MYKLLLASLLLLSNIGYAEVKIPGTLTPQFCGTNKATAEDSGVFENAEVCLFQVELPENASDQLKEAAGRRIIGIRPTNNSWSDFETTYLTLYPNNSKEESGVKGYMAGMLVSAWNTSNGEQRIDLRHLEGLEGPNRDESGKPLFPYALMKAGKEGYKVMGHAVLTNLESMASSMISVDEEQ